MLHVNPISGNDAIADGSDRAPFKTITRALEAALPNTVIQLAPGIYSSSTGETFPIALKPRVTLQGNPETRGQQVVIRGGGAFSSPGLTQQNITILGGANQASLTGVTITNPNGYGLQIESSSPTIANNTFTHNSRGGIIVVGSSKSIIRNNFFYQNEDVGVRIQGSAYPTLQENIVEQNGVGVFVDSTAAPRLLDNRITQNKTGVIVQGEAKPYLRGNSVEGNEEFGLTAIAPAQPDLGSSADANANFFRNNRKQDIALQTTSSANAAPPANKPANQLVKQSLPKAHAPSTATQKQREIISPPAPTQRGAVVVPTITTPAVQPVPTVTFGDRIQANPPGIDSPPSINQTLPRKPLEPKSSPQSTKPPVQPVPQAYASSSGITSTAFPKPSALSNAGQTSATPRPIQVIRLTSPPVDNIPPSADSSLGTITIAPRSNGSRLPLTPTTAQSSPTPTGLAPVPTTRRIQIPMPVRPAIAEEIPAPPTVLPRSAATVLPKAPLRIPAQRPQTTPEFPPPIRLIPHQPATATQPSRSTQPASAPPLFSPTVPSSRSIVIPVPPPETGYPRPVPAKPAASPLSPPALANNLTSAKSGNLLPVPGPNIPVGNIGDMPSVYSARGNQQSIPGVPITPGNVGSVVVKYRVVVVATDDNQQEQVRTIVPDAFPVVYRGQRVMQAGAFGDRSKADQLVASLNVQGLQAIIEPLD
jgi:parallel beta-helix repeat protein